jgi:hypothetical protein
MSTMVPGVAGIDAAADAGAEAAIGLASVAGSVLVVLEQAVSRSPAATATAAMVRFIASPAIGQKVQLEQRTSHLATAATRRRAGGRS